MRTLLTLLLLVVARTALAQPYATGYRDLDLYDELSSRRVPVRVYYPASVPGDGAPYATTDTLFPAVGFGGHPGIEIGAYRRLVDNLVSHGYVVAIPRSSGSLGSDVRQLGLDLGGIAISLHSATGDSSSPLFGAPISRRNAVGGHGLGGAASVHGAYELDSLEQPHFTLGATAAVDPRVLRAARGLRGPALTISGANDCIAPDSLNGLRLHDTLGSDCKARALIVGGSHCYFASHDVTCQVSEAECTVSPEIGRDDQQRTVDSLLLPWLDWHLKDRCDGLVRFTAFLDSSRFVRPTSECAESSTLFSLVPDDRLGICPGDSAVLIAPAGYASYRWTTGATTRSITVSTPGTYSVVAAGGSGCDLRSRPVVVHHTASPPLLQASAPGLCAGSTVRLRTDHAAAPHRWSTGETSSEITVSAPGPYWVVVTIDGCTLTSDTVTLVASTKPRVAVEGAVEGCEGTALPTLRAPASLARVRWSNGHTGSAFIPPGPGASWFTAIDTLGCDVISDTITVVRHAPVVPMVSLAGVTLTSSPATAYQWLESGAGIPGATDRTHIATRTGDYAVRTVDANGCTATSTAVTVRVSGIAGDDGDVRITMRDGALVIDGNDAAVSIAIVDARGVRRALEASKRIHPLDRIPSGVYRVVVELSDRRRVIRAITIVR